VKHDISCGVKLCSSFLGSNKLAQENRVNVSFFYVTIIGIIGIIVIIVQVHALLETVVLTESAQHKGHFSMYNCLVLVTPSTMVSSEFTATRFLRSRFMAVTAGIPS
jgi:hypothetical protein